MTSAPASPIPAPLEARTSAPVWLAILLLVFWIVLQLVVSGIFLFGYAIATDQIDMLTDRDGAMVMVNGMSIGFTIFMLLTQTIVIWIVVLVGSYLTLRFTLAEKTRPAILTSAGIQRATGVLSPWFMALLVDGATYGVAIGIQYLIPGEERAEHLERLVETPLGFVGLLILAVGLAPICEELFFRGYLYPSIRDALAKIELGHRPVIILAIVVNSILFSGVHTATYGFELGFLLPLFAMSLVMAGLREYTKSVWPCVLAHLMFNLLSMVLVGIDQYTDLFPG